MSVPCFSPTSHSNPEKCNNDKMLKIDCNKNNILNNQQLIIARQYLLFLFILFCLLSDFLKSLDNLKSEQQATHDISRFLSFMYDTFCCYLSVFV